MFTFSAAEPIPVPDAEEFTNVDILSNRFDGQTIFSDIVEAVLFPNDQLAAGDDVVNKLEPVLVGTLMKAGGPAT
tara:strand:- start:71 stop:295 length:225 start_codon:yes stop_codon:yes gene_type:complete